MEKKTDFYSEMKLKSLGFLFIGENVKIHKSVCFYNIDKISIGNHVRINPFSIISGCVELEDGVSIGEYSIISAQKGKVIIKKNVNIYQRVVIDSDSNEIDLIIIDEGIKIETQCIITKSVYGNKDIIIPMLSII